MNLARWANDRSSALRQVLAFLVILATASSLTLQSLAGADDGLTSTGPTNESTLQTDASAQPADLSVIATPEAVDTPIASIPTRVDADRLGEEILASFEKDKKYDITVLHMGNYVPNSLRYLAVKLKKKGYDVNIKVRLIREEDITNEIQSAQSEAESRIMKLSYLSTEQKHSFLESVRKTVSEANLLRKQIFGIPNGASWWITVKRSKADWRAAISSATTAVLTCSISSSFIFYISKARPDFSHIAANLIGFGAWVGAWALFGRNVSEIFKQGKSLTATNPTELKVTDSQTFFYSLSFARSLITSTLFAATAFTSSLLEMATWIKNPINSAVNTPGQWIAKWVQSKNPKAAESEARKAELKEKGWLYKFRSFPHRVSQKELTVGEWEFLNTAIVTVYSTIKTMDQVARKLQRSWVIFPSITYYTLGTIGLFKMFVPLKYDTKLYFNQLKAWGKSVLGIHEVRAQCESYLIISDADAQNKGA